VNVDQARRAMIEGLIARGELTPQWDPAFEAVPRHEFIPDTVYRFVPDSDGPDLLPLRRADDPAAWLEIAYANAPVNTQVDDGHPDEQGRGRELTSSASQPAVVAEMLTALRVEPGMRVLEIGTGTGWNAALLGYRLGPDKVTSVEVDPAVAEHARGRLAGQGLGEVVVVTADGADGWPPEAPYDRVIATVAARQVPPAWVAQTRSGGEILVPWGSRWYPASLLRIIVGDGNIGVGQIIGSASFMALRSQRVSRWAAAELVGSGDIVTTTTELHPWHIAAEPAAATAIGFRVPDCQQNFVDGDEKRSGRLNMVDQVSGSWARLTLVDEPPYRVEQAGPRKLFDEVEAAHRWWVDRGRPGVEEWRVTVDWNGQRIELA
jgi:protein-L-isoaspartate(D-aspartate) O-methyltransferase